MEPELFHLAKSTRDPRHCRKALAKSDLGGGKLQLLDKELFDSTVLLASTQHSADGKVLHLEIHQNYD
jgi:hypothetical protein